MNDLGLLDTWAAPPPPAPKRVAKSEGGFADYLAASSNSSRPDRPVRPVRPDRPDRAERAERTERPARPERPERLERPERPENPERPERRAEAREPQEPQEARAETWEEREPRESRETRTEARAPESQEPEKPEKIAPPRLAAARPSGDLPGLVEGLLANKGLKLQSATAASATGAAGAGASAAGAIGFALGGRASEKISAALDQARSAWPEPFKKQVGLGLTALGRQGHSPDSMAVGAALLGAASPAEILSELMGAFKGELGLLKLPAAAKGDLERLLNASGLTGEQTAGLMGRFGPQGLKLSELDQALSRLNLKAGRTKGLVADETAINELSAFLASLGAAPEELERLLGDLQPGQELSGAELADFFRQALGSGDSGSGDAGSGDAGGLTGDLSRGDLYALTAFLKHMGAEAGEMEKLGALLTQTQGQAPTEEFLAFLEGLGAPKPATGDDLATLKSLLESVTKEAELVRAPLFDEALMKLRALGDESIDDDFLNLSPALQALRGGLPSSGDLSRHQQSGGGRDDGRRYRQAFQAQATGEGTAAPAGAAAASAAGETAGYGGQSETLNRQVAQKIIYARRRGLHRLKMNLNPAELGRLDIELSVKGGSLSARLRAADKEAYEALSSELESLRQSLAESGVEVSDLTLTYEDEGGRTFSLGLAELTAEAQWAEAQRAAETRRAASAAKNKTFQATEINRLV